MIYTTGFGDKEVGDLTTFLGNLDAVLIDIRFSPSSNQLVWTKNYLSLLLKRRYKHIPQLGNRGKKTENIQIQNLELGIRLITSLDYNAVLFCECIKLKDCHRFVIKNELSNRRFDTLELDSWKTNSTLRF